MLNGTWQMKVAWIVLAGALILNWAVTLFSRADTESTLAATAGMLLGAILFSVNAAALAEQTIAARGPEGH